MTLLLPSTFLSKFYGQFDGLGLPGKDNHIIPLSNDAILTVDKILPSPIIYL